MLGLGHCTPSQYTKPEILLFTTALYTLFAHVSPSPAPPLLYPTNNVSYFYSFLGAFRDEFGSKAVGT